MAYFNGAHGSPVRTISGTVAKGANVMILTKKSEFCEQDNGYEIAYRIPVDCQLKGALGTSCDTGRPIRVFRTADCSSEHNGCTIAPIIGVRYDGRYRVVSTEAVVIRLEWDTKYNVLQYVLRRLPGQPPLKNVVAARPSVDEQEQYSEYQRVYSAA